MLKLLLFVAFIAFVAASRYERAEEIVSEINSMNGNTWTAGHNQFSHWTEEEIKMLAKTNLGKVKQTKAAKKIPDVSKFKDLPDQFDARQKWPQCSDIGTVRNQAKCGSCWAFAGAESLGDRFCIKTSQNATLSPQYLVSCDNTNFGCQGGQEDLEWLFMMYSGISTDKCVPYVSGDGHVPPCPKKCVDGSDIKLYKAATYHHLGWYYFGREKAIMQDIVDNGSAEFAFSVYEDFLQYKSGVYQHQTGGLLGGHAVKGIGYGVENGTPYWLIVNSWGPEWGENGLFKILRGSNDCGIESSVYSGVPSVPHEN